MEAFGGASTDDGCLAILQECIPLIFWNDKLGKNLALILRVDYELRKEIFFVLIDPPEPVIVSDHLHARNTQDFVAIGQRQRIDDRGPIDNHQAICTSNIGSAAKRIAHHSEESEQEEGDGERADGQKEAELFAKEIGDDQAAEFHAAPPAATPSSW